VTTATASYDEVVARCRRMVEENVPSHAGVAVVSRGDDRLTDLGSRRAWHLPSLLDGTYAGHHPADGEEAVAHLDALRGRGAEFLLIPKTSLWWLDHYGELREHLADRCPAPHEDPAAGRLYRLGPTAAPAERVDPPSRPTSTGVEKALGRNVSELVEALLPPRATVGVVGVPERVPLQLGRRSVRRWGTDGLPEAVALLAAQEGFLVLTQDAYRDLERDARADRLLGERCRTVTDQRHVCRILEVRGAPAPPPPPPAAVPAAVVEPWHRRMWRRWRRP
jgi:hypothetical protein